MDLSTLKFSDINLLGFLQFYLKILTIFDEKTFKTEYSPKRDDSNIITKIISEPEFGLELLFYNPTGGESIGVNRAEDIVSNESRTIQVEFYSKIMDGGISTDIPLKFFDDEKFITSLIKIVGKVPLVPYGEKDPRMLDEFAKQWFIEEARKMHMYRSLKFSNII